MSAREFTESRRRRAVRWIRVAGAMVAALSLAGLAVLSAGAPRASAADASAMTVSWLNDSSPAAQYQPQRPADDASGALDDFGNLKVTVEQTTNLIDQTVRVDFQGMAATTGPGGQLKPASASNFLQIMQCWGADPNAADFRDTCAFGAWASSGLDTGPSTQLSNAGAGPDVTARPDDVPFTTPDGQQTTPDPTHGDNGVREYFNSVTGNEQDFVTIPDDGGSNAGFTLFNTQSAASAPWLGCGQPTTDSGAGNRCWLVIVPRGTHSGGVKGSTARCESNTQYADDGYGTVTSLQLGSPLGTDCSYWDDRMVVPLDFLPVASHCQVGSKEVGTNGSLLMDGAMHSWQQALCEDVDLTYNIANNSGALTRSQLLSGQVDLGIIGEPVTKNDDDSGGAEWSAADIRYGPVANAALTIGFIAENRLGQQVNELKLTPRIVAKLLTQSYQYQVPMNAHIGQFQVPQLGNNPGNLGNDPEFEKLNPGVTPLGIFVSTDVGFVEPGPQGDDALRLLWQWIDADTDARNFLAGQPDPYGMVVNPYFLPHSNPKSLGGGLGGIDLAKGVDTTTGTPVERIYRADPTTLVPDATHQEITLDSTSLNPFASDFATAAGRIARGDTQHGQDSLVPAAATPTLQADPARVVGADNKDVLGITDVASATLNGLNMAALQLPNSQTFVAPTAASMTAAVQAEVLPTQKYVADTMATLDFAHFPQDGYPLTTTLYAAANVRNTAITAQQWAQYVLLVSYILTDGQSSGTEPGDLPDGYTPLTALQGAQLSNFGGLMLGLLSPTSPPKSTPTKLPSPGELANGTGSPQSAIGGDVPPTVDVPSDAPSAPAAVAAPDNGGPTVGSGASDEASVAPPKQTASKTYAGQAALGGSLGLGAAGMIAAPLLMRRKVLKP